MLSENAVYNTDLLSLCAEIAPASVDMILCDLPYGTTACAWDTVIPFEPMWAAFKRIVKPNAAIVLTASQPFTSALVMSNPRMFRYAWVWDKKNSSGFQNANIQPLRRHEDVLIFSIASAYYDPQMTIGEPYKVKRGGSPAIYGIERTSSVNLGLRYPTTIIEQPYGGEKYSAVHPTQKPVALFEYLIRTYTRPGDLVVDPCVGSGTTAVAARQLNRRFIVGDTSAEYCEVARKRLELPFTLPMFEAASD